MLKWMMSIFRWNVPDALRCSKDILTAGCRPWCMVKAVLPWPSSSVSICLYLPLASNAENTAALPSELIRACIRGIRYKSRFVTASSLQESTQIGRVPRFLGTNTLSASHSFCAGTIMVLARTFFISAFLTSLVFGPARFGAERSGTMSGL